MTHDPDFIDPPREFSLCPFWFWNDALSESEIARQIDDFQRHGVHAFVIHPRVGLPRSIGWMSDRMLDFIRFAVEEAERRGMWVVLYDEGMYPSGSSSGQVVAENPDFKCRGLQLLEDGSVIDRPIDSVIRGLHYIGDGPAEDEPPAADLLNPAAVACFIHKVYDRYFEVLGAHFGRTIKGIFTDEPSLLGRSKEDGLLPGTRGIFEHIARLTGHDLAPIAHELWDENSESRAIYERGVRLRLEETFYRPLHSWCEAHGVELMGHPEHPDELEVLRRFHVPGQDLVWRWVLPGPSAFEGPQSTQAKVAASAMIAHGRRRNSNEFAGAYGHQLTFSEFKWLRDWCIIRGTNLFFPHAFYYSLRGPRCEERPPDVGPNSSWWPAFADFALETARLCWLNTDSEPIVNVGILTTNGRAPWRIAKSCLQRQIDFHYIEAEDGEYRWTLDDDQEMPSELIQNGRVLPIEMHPDLRARHVRKLGRDYYLLHNENGDSLDLATGGSWRSIDLITLGEATVEQRIRLQPFELRLLIPLDKG